MTKPISKTEFDELYPRLAHALQSGVQTTFQLDQDDVAHNRKTASGISTSPKMLRTGVNMAMVEQSAIAALLIEKGVITEGEYRAVLVRGLRNEVERYEEELSTRIGRPVALA